MTQNQGNTLIYILGAVVVVLLIGFLLYYVLSRLFTGGFVGPVLEPQTEAQVPTVADILEDPDIYNGKVVVLTGEVTDWVTERAFLLSQEQGVIVIDSGLLVIQREPFQLPRDAPEDDLALAENPEVTVTGTVAILNIIEMEQTLQTDLDDELYFNWVDRPVLIAQKIEIISNQ